MASIILPRRFYSQPQGAVEPVAGIGVSSLVVPANWYGYTTTAAPTVAVGTQGVLLKSESNKAARYKAADLIALTPAASIMWVGEFYGSGTSEGCLGGITYANTNTAPYVGIELKRLNVGGASGNVYLTWNNTSTYLYLGNSVSQDVTGQFVIIGSVRSGSQFFLLRNLTTGSTTYLTNTVSGNIAYGSAPRLEVGDSLNARHPNAGCAMLATFDHAISEGFARDLLDNPWQIFRPRRRVVYFDVGGGSSHNVTAANAVIASSASGAAISQAHPVTAAHASSQPSASGAVVAQSHLVAVATAVSATASSGAAIQQTQRVEAASASSQPTASGASVSQSVTHYAVIASASVQPVASGAAVSRAHHIAGASAITQHAAAGAAIAQTHLATPASAASQPIASGAAASADGTQHIGIANASSPPVASGAAIIQTHRITLPGVAIDSIASGSAIVQAHLVGASNVVSIVRTSGVNAGDGDLIGLPNLVVAVPAEQRILRVPAEKRIFRAQK